MLESDCECEWERCIEKGYHGERLRAPEYPSVPVPRHRRWGSLLRSHTYTGRVIVTPVPMVPLPLAASSIHILQGSPLASSSLAPAILGSRTIPHSRTPSRTFSLIVCAAPLRVYDVCVCVLKAHVRFSHTCYCIHVYRNTMRIPVLWWRYKSCFYVCNNIVYSLWECWYHLWLKSRTDTLFICLYSPRLPRILLLFLYIIPLYTCSSFFFLTPYLIRDAHDRWRRLHRLDNVVWKQFTHFYSRLLAMLRTFLRFSKIYNFVNGDQNSRNICEGEVVVMSGQIVAIGCTNKIGKIREILSIRSQAAFYIEMKCSCKAGLSGTCKHIAAVLLYLERYVYVLSLPPLLIADFE